MELANGQLYNTSFQRGHRWASLPWLRPATPTVSGAWHHPQPSSPSLSYGDTEVQTGPASHCWPPGKTLSAEVPAQTPLGSGSYYSHSTRAGGSQPNSTMSFHLSPRSTRSRREREDLRPSRRPSSIEITLARLRAGLAEPPLTASLHKPKIRAIAKIAFFL